MLSEKYARAGFNPFGPEIYVVVVHHIRIFWPSRVMRQTSFPSLVPSESAHSRLVAESRCRSGEQ